MQKQCLRVAGFKSYLFLSQLFYILKVDVPHSLLLFENTVLSTFVFEVVPYTWLIRNHAAASLSPGVLSRHSVTWSSASPAVVALNAVRSKRNFSSMVLFSFEPVFNFYPIYPLKIFYVICYQSEFIFNCRNPDHQIKFIMNWLACFTQPNLLFCVSSY